jgi:hypothetical protein
VVWTKASFGADIISGEIIGNEINKNKTTQKYATNFFFPANERYFSIQLWN